MNTGGHTRRPWRIESIYRLGIWLPVLVPAIVALVTHGGGMTVAGDIPLGKVSQILLASLLYGGVPYVALALWATWWMVGRPESEVRHLMFRAPFLMAAVFMVTAFVTGIAVGQPRSFIALGILGAIAAVPLGYVYVLCVVLMREELGPPV